MNATCTRLSEAPGRDEGPASILLVEDDAIAAGSIERSLASLGYVVTTASSGDDRLRRPGSLNPKLILSTTSANDAGEGIEAARLLGEGLGVPVVPLLKPFTERELAIAVESALVRRALERELESVHAELAEKTALLEGVLGSGSLPAVVAEEQFSSGIWSSARPVAGASRPDGTGK